jgi:hypothetical protein
MIDFFKSIVVIDDTKQIRTNPLLDWNETYNCNTTELRNPKATFNSLELEFKSQHLLEISGSLHKYYNHIKGIVAPNQNDSNKHKGFNGNQFSLVGIDFALKHLENALNLPLNQFKLQNLEFGLNIENEFNTSQILNGLMLHKGETFNKPLQNTYREAEHQRYYVKIYDKALQYGMQGNILRIENKYRKAISINAFGIKTLADINKNTLYELFKDLVETFNDIIIFDYTIDKTKLSSRQITKLKDYSNENFWTSLNKIQMYRANKKHNEIIANFSMNIKAKIIEKMFDIFILLNKKCIPINSSGKKRPKKTKMYTH